MKRAPLLAILLMVACGGAVRRAERPVAGGGAAAAAAISSRSTPVDFTAWHEEEPNDFNRENCGELYADSWTWTTSNATSSCPIVCEGPALRR